MKLGKIVGLVMLLALMTYAAVALYGTLGPLPAGLLFFMISSVTLTLTILMYRPVLKKDTGYVIFQVIIICAAFSSLIGIARLYQDNMDTSRMLLDNAYAETDYISNLNAYYSDYITYLDGELTKLNLSNADLQAKIAQIKSTPIQVPAAPSAQQSPTPPAEQQVIYNTIYEDVPQNEDDGHNEREEEYDD